MSTETRRLSTHRTIQIADLADRARTERVSYYCRAIKADDLGNSGAARHFNALAQKWEQIRIRADRFLINDRIAKATGEKT